MDQGAAVFGGLAVSAISISLIKYFLSINSTNNTDQTNDAAISESCAATTVLVNADRSLIDTECEGLTFGEVTIVATRGFTGARDDTTSRDDNVIEIVDEDPTLRDDGEYGSHNDVFRDSTKC